jgi:ABC-2 type transport system permease protein
VTDVDVYSYSYTTSFDGEGAITSAIDYVVSDELPQIYCLEGHGESDLPSTFSEQIDKANIEVNTLSLLTVDQIPEDASCIVIYAPQSDISQEEKEMLADYVSQGGKLLVMAGPVEDSSLENLYDILADYNITANEGIVIEADRDHYAFQRPYILIPDMNSSDVTDSLMDENYYPIMPISLGLTVGYSSAEVTELLVTSEDSFSKLDGYSLSTYDKEDGDIDGSFAVAVSVETDNEGQIIWFASSDFLDDMYNAYSSGANDDLAMNALSALIGEREALAIRSKSLNYNYLTISDAEGSVLKVWMIGILPLMYLGVGIFVTVYTRSKQNEAI